MVAMVIFVTHLLIEWLLTINIEHFKNQNIWYYEWQEEIDKKTLF